MVKASIIGSGAWGTTLAKILAENGHEVMIWSHDQQIADDINNNNKNSALLPGIKLPKTIKAATEIDQVCFGTNLIGIVVASNFYRQTVEKLAGFIPDTSIIVSASKGLDERDNKRMSEVLCDLIPNHMHSKVAVLSGPNIAMEIAQQKPATTVISAYNSVTASSAQKYFNNKYFRVYTNNDVIGTEMGGILKNIIAIAAGINDGLDLGANTRAAIVVRGLVEISRFAVEMGADSETMFGLSGLGDLVTTCSSSMSRNHFVGENLAKGKKLSEIIEKMTAVAEGIRTTKIVYEIAEKKKIDMPVTEQIYAVLFQNKSVTQAIEDLMTRDLKAEV